MVVWGWEMRNRSRLGGWGARDSRGEGGWRTKLKIALYEGDIGGTWGKPPANGSRESWNMGEGASCGPGGPGARDAQGGRFGRRNRKLCRMGTMTVGPEENPLLTAAGGCGMWERGPITGLGGLEPETHRWAGLARETENRAQGARYRWDLGYDPS